MSAIGVGVATKLSGSTPYLNSSLETATLYKFVEFVSVTIDLNISGFFQFERDVHVVSRDVATATITL